jgi:hypothetical protein
MGSFPRLDGAAAAFRRRSARAGAAVGGVSQIFPCWFCRAPDARGEDHQRGCPRLPPVTDERLRELAAACERGWRYAAVDHAERWAAKAQREARRDVRPGPMAGMEARL